MKMYFILVLIMNSLIGWIIYIGLVQFFFFYLFPQKKAKIYQWIEQTIKQEFVSNEFSLSDKIDQINLKKEVSPILDEKLDGFIEKLESQIPFGGILLTQSFKAKMKSQAKQEMLNALPEIKEVLVHKMNKEFDFKAFIQEKVRHYPLDPLIDKLAKRAFKWQWMGALMGLGIGLLNGLLIFLVG